MSRYLLDTNIISSVTKPVPPESLLSWMADQADENLFISALTIAEIRRGVLEKPAGRIAVERHAPRFRDEPEHGPRCRAMTL